MSMELLCESEQQSQNLMDSQIHHNFQNQLSYLHFQEESTELEKSMEDMTAQNSVTQSVNKLEA